MSGPLSHSFWLLAAATLCADALAAYTVASDRSRMQLVYTLNVWSALTLAHVCVVAIWLAFRQRSDLWSWVLPPVILVAASILRTRVGLFGPWSTLDYGCRTALQMLLTIVLIWLLVRTPLWRWWAPKVAQRKWEFSIRQLLSWTTVVAMFSAIIARATWTDHQPLSLTQTAGIFAPAAISVGVVLVAGAGWHWLARFLGYVVIGAAVATMLNWLLNWQITDRLFVEFIAESLMIAAWVEWGGIVPYRETVTPDRLMGACT